MTSIEDRLHSGSAAGVGKNAEFCEPQSLRPVVCKAALATVERRRDSRPKEIARGSAPAGAATVGARGTLVRNSTAILDAVVRPTLCWAPCSCSCQ